MRQIAYIKVVYLYLNISETILHVDGLIVPIEIQRLSNRMKEKCNYMFTRDTSKQELRWGARQKRVKEGEMGDFCNTLNNKTKMEKDILCKH